jgi:hypothetical protein
LKEEQHEAIHVFMEKKEIVCLLPTGFGKRVISVADPEIPKGGTPKWGDTPQK